MKEKPDSLTWGAIGVVCLFVLVAGISLYNTRELYRDAQWVSHSHQVLDELAELKQSVFVAQSRGWDDPDDGAAGGDAMQGALDAMGRHAVSIGHLTEDNSHQQAKVVEIQQQIPEFARLLNQIAATERTQGIDAARQLARA